MIIRGPLVEAVVAGSADGDYVTLNLHERRMVARILYDRDIAITTIARRLYVSRASAWDYIHGRSAP